MSALPVRLLDDQLQVAVADPSDQLGKDLTQAASMRVLMVVASASDIARAIDRNDRALADVNRHVAAFSAVDDRRRFERRPAVSVTAEAPVVHVVNLIVTQALRDRASDVHIESGGTTVRVRFRFEDSGGTVPAGGFFVGEGCTFCSDTGYSDRIGVYELIVMTTDLRQLVVERASYEQIRELAIAAQGTRTLRMEAASLVEAGTTTIADTIRSIYTL